ncbi:MAG TPA: hypothetical protein VGD84_15430 [Pseudonocardiaceae bacterium]
MYEDIVAAARQSSESAVRESQERVNLAMSRAAEADRKATEATKAIGDRWVNRINAMRRRAEDRAKDELRFDPDPTDGHELVSLSASPADAETPAYGIPADLINQAATPPTPRPTDPNSAWFTSAIDVHEEEHPPAAPPRRAARRRPHATDEDDDYSGQSWLQGQ